MNIISNLLNKIYTTAYMKFRRTDKTLPNIVYPIQKFYSIFVGHLIYSKIFLGCATFKVISSKYYNRYIVRCILYYEGKILQNILLKQHYSELNFSLIFQLPKFQPLQYEAIERRKRKRK